MSTIDRTHLNALLVRLSNERARLANAQSKQEIEMRSAWVKQYEKEVAFEEASLSDEISDEVENMSDEELLAELLGK